MASVGDIYLPSLADCFAGRTSVISWAGILQHLEHEDPANFSFPLLPFLTSPSAEKVLSIPKLLSLPVPIFPKPSASSRTNFESRTAAITVEPTAARQLNIEEIKDDTEWLSKSLVLDEVECLRLVVLEWQTRPSGQLSYHLSETETASLRDAVGREDYTLVDRVKPGAGENGNLNSGALRRVRLLTLSMKEQASMYRVAAALTDIKVRLDFKASSGIELHPRTIFEGRLRATIQGSLSSSSPTTGGLSACFDGLREFVESAKKGPGWVGEAFDSTELREEWTMFCLYKLTSLLELLLLHHNAYDAHKDPTRILAWLNLMSELRFSLSLEPETESQASLCAKVDELASSCTLAMLYLGPATEYIERIRENPDTQLENNGSLPYFMDPDTATEIHQIMVMFAASCDVAVAPAVLAWGLILGNVREIAAISKELREASHVQKALDLNSRDSPSVRRLSSSSITSVQQSLSEDVVDSIRAFSNSEDEVEMIISSAVYNCDVFRHIVNIFGSSNSGLFTTISIQAEIFQQLLNTSIAHMNYSDSIVDAQLALIIRLADAADEVRRSGDLDYYTLHHFHEKSGVRDILDIASSRFPYETRPFLQLCKSLARFQYIDKDGQEYVVTFLQNLSTFTQQTQPSFSAYHTTQEYENANLVSLDTQLRMLDGLDSQKLLSFGEQAVNIVDTIPPGTIGEVMNEKKPPVIKWVHNYSGFAFLGFWLDSFRYGQLQTTTSDQDELSITAAVILELLSSVLSTTYHSTPTSTSTLLDEIVSSLPTDVDLASIVFDICEQQLQSLRFQKQNFRSCDIIVASLRLITTLLPVLPNRVWSSLSKSSLLDTRGTSGGVLAILLSIETAQEDYNFLETFTELYQAVVINALKESVLLTHTTGSVRIPSREMSSNAGIPKHIISDIIFTCTRILADAFQDVVQGKFASSSQRHRIATGLASTFDQVMCSVYGVDDSPNMSAKLASSLASSAAYLSEFFRPHPDEVSGPVCLLRWLLVSWQSATKSQELVPERTLLDQICAVSSLTRTMLRFGIFLDQPPSALESQLLDALPILIRLGLPDDNCLSAALGIIQCILLGFPQDAAPSLISRLGSASGRAFLETLCPFARQCESERLSTSEDAHGSYLRTQVWNLFTSFISHNQQWFAISLLTGSPPDYGATNFEREDKQRKQLPFRSKAILTEALDFLNTIEKSNLSDAMTVLNFVVKAQMHWNWVTDSIETHATLLPNLITYVSSMRFEDTNQLSQSQSNKITAFTVELATVQLHHARLKRDKAMIHRMIPLMSWLSMNAIRVDGYNVSLHNNLRKNFTVRYGPCTLENFKRTRLTEPSYGNEFFYDVALAAKILSHGVHRSRRPDFDKTFHHELIRVNLNLSLVDSQMLLLDNFQTFCIEHCAFFSQDQQVQKMMATLIQNLLSANRTCPPSEAMFQNLFQIRAEFALVLIRRLVIIKSRGSEFTRLLNDAWSTLRYRNSSYEFAMEQNDLLYFRTTLTIVLLSMQFHIDDTTSRDRLALVSIERDPTSSIVLEIASVIVADGMKSVVAGVHDQAMSSREPTTSSPTSTINVKDVSLILSILQTILRIHILPQITSQLGSGFVSSNIIQSCLLLYSWSHSLAKLELNHEPDYGDLSLRFLVSLSSLSQVAEELAVEGVLSRISTARVTQVLRARNPGASQFAKGSLNRSIYVIWSAGILPLCLNLLHSVGRTMAGEVAIFLNQFSQQLSRANRAFSFRSSGSEPVTLALANEGAILALISKLLTSYRQAGASAGVDASNVPVLAGYDEQKLALVEDVKEILVAGKLKVRAAPTNEKEALWQKSKNAAGRDKLEEAIAAELSNIIACLGDQTGLVG